MKVLILGATGGTGRAITHEAAKRGYRAFSFDPEGHGDNDWSPDGKYTLDRFTADVPARELLDLALHAECVGIHRKAIPPIQPRPIGHLPAFGEQTNQSIRSW